MFHIIQMQQRPQNKKRASEKNAPEINQKETKPIRSLIKANALDSDVKNA